MKLHGYKKYRKNAQRFISILLVACMALSGSSAYRASAEETEGQQGVQGNLHEHTDSCYEGRIVCGLEEQEEQGGQQILVCAVPEAEGHLHTEDCFLEDGSVVCGLEEQEGHEHNEGCYTEETGGEPHQHTEACYEYDLICGMEEHTGESGTEEGTEPEESAPETESTPETESAPEPGTAPESDPAASGEETETAKDSSREEDDAEEDPAESLPLQDAEAVEAVNQLIAATPGLEEMEELLAGCQEDREAWYQCLGQLGDQMREAAGAWMELDEGQRGQAEGIDELLGAMKRRKEIEDSFLERPVYCGKEFHVHREAEGCYGEEGGLNCEKEEHIHQKECFRNPDVTEEEQAAIEKANVLIADLPAPEEIRKELEQYGEDETGYGECLARAEEQYTKAKSAWDVLTENGRNYVVNGEKLGELEAALAEWKKPDTESPEENTHCGMKEHTHTEACFGENGETVCEMEEHTHIWECFLTEEEAAQVRQVNQLIAALPSQEEIMQKIAEYEAAETGEDGLAEGTLEDGMVGTEDAYAAYLISLMEQIAEAMEVYGALDEELQQYVEGAEYLLALSTILSGMTLEEGVWGAMEPDEAYVNEIKVTSIATGAAPFDQTEGQGNDTTANDMIVRTFDTVTYNFLVNMKSWNSSKSYSEARVKLEFVLPLTEQEAVFDQTAMAWMDQTDGYQPQLTTETRTIEGEEKTCQVLTCYKRLLPSAGNQSVVPGDFGENVTVNVRAMKNNEEFAPVFSAAMEGGAWDGPCEKDDHEINGQPAIEKKTVTADKVRVTAAPRYNVHIEERDSYKADFDFQGDNAWMAQYKDVAANTDIATPVPGRMMKFGITLQLYNDNESKGLKGIELPTGEISFDLEVSSRYTINTPAEGTDFEPKQVVETNDGYRPLLWSYGSNTWMVYGAKNTDGRVIYDELACAPLAPYSNGYDPVEDIKKCCYRSGTWKATQDRDTGTIHITVSDYEINPDWMPVVNGDTSSGSYGANVGCFSSGAIWIVQPFNTITGDEHGEDPYFDVVKTYGQGAFSTNVKDVKLKATTLSGTTVQEGVDGFKQMVTNDDDKNLTLELTLPGLLQNRIRYASATYPTKQGSGVDNYQDGRDYAAVGSELYLMGGFSYNPRNEADNQLYLGTNLTKFYGRAIELKEESWFLDFSGGAELKGATGESAKKYVRVRYATKRDGKDWKDDNELLHTYEDDLVFYESLKDIPENHICVGILFSFIGPGAPVNASDPYYNCFHKAQIRDDMELAGKSFMLASTSRVWTKGMFEAVDYRLDDIPDWKYGSTKLSSFPVTHYTSANIEGSTWYIKETYKSDGSGIYGTHNSDWAHWGDTLLVIGYKTKVSKSLQQKDNNEQVKKTFNLDADQRVVDFKLEPGTYYDLPGEFGNSTTVTIVDTLPKYLTYRPGSAYFGGAYEQTSVNGGTQGRITTDESSDAKFPTPVLTEPQVVKNADGTQTLTWKLTDVEIGASMAPIYYSADIGTKGNPEEDVPTGTTNLENQVYITAPGDLRDPLSTGEKHSEAGIAVTRGSASSFGKYTRQKVVDEDGAIDYVVYYNNNAETGTTLTIMDTMPMNGVNGSHFTGTYTFDQWKLDVDKCNVNNINIYYTFEKKYQDKTTEDVKREEIENWNSASIASDGTIAISTAENGATADQPYPVAWAVVGTLDSGESVSIDLRIQLDPGASGTEKTENNYFVNLLSSGDTTTTTETPTVRRTLEGLAWMDYNRDGLQDDLETEVRISGVKVELLKLKEGEGLDPQNESSYENVYYPNTVNPVVIETGQQISVRAEDGNEPAPYETGRYKFTDLSAGTYAVRFTDGSGETKITGLSATSVNCGEDDTRDSDAVASRDESGKLVKTTILNLEMPKAEDMNVSLYESKYHDSGFYPDTQMQIKKVSVDGRVLSGAIFTIQDDKGNILSFTNDGERGYTPYDEEGEESRKGKYYIALASNPYYVIGINGTGDGSLPILQNRTGSASQLFEVQRDGDLYSFRNVAAGKWLDLDAGSLSKGAKVHVWSNATPNENQKWYVIPSDNGSYISPSKGKDNWSLDLDGAVTQENQKIHLWEKNTSSAQKWVLIPAGITSDTQTDLSVDSSGSLTINNLKSGNYTIKEIKSPTGHSLLSQPVAFTVQGDGSVEVTGSPNGMAYVDSGNSATLIIQNAKLYELPSTGGSGTGTYTAAGMALMIGSLLYALYGRKKKRA